VHSTEADVTLRPASRTQVARLTFACRALARSVAKWNRVEQLTYAHTPRSFHDRSRAACGARSAQVLAGPSRTSVRAALQATTRRACCLLRRVAPGNEWATEGAEGCPGVRAWRPQRFTIYAGIFALCARPRESAGLPW
jgi:hypothetical protein